MRAEPIADGTFGAVAPAQCHTTAVTTPAIAVARMSKANKVMGKRAPA